MVAFGAIVLLAIYGLPYLLQPSVERLTDRALMPEDQQRVKDAIVQDWEAYNGSELFEFNKNRMKN